MKSFLKFISKNLIGFGSVFIIVLMFTAAIISFYNKHQIIETTTEKKTAEEVKISLERVFININRLDLSLRGYVITKDENMLSYVQIFNKETQNVLEMIDSLLSVQGLDTSLIAFKNVKIGVNKYLLFTDKMRIEAKNEDITKFREMLTADKGGELYYIFAPFQKNIDKYEDEVISKAEKGYESAVNRTIILQLLLLIFGLPILVFMVLRLNRENKSRKDLLTQLEKNNKKYIFNNGSEIDSTDTKKVIEHSIQNFIKANQFITNISDGNYEGKWEGLDDQNIKLNQDTLAGRLLKMREEMKQVRKADERRNWVNEGLTKFSEIVRNNQNDVETLSYKCIQFLTKYLNAQQGSLFIVKGKTPENKYLELTGCYAYNKKKYIEKKIGVGNGMLGQVYLEAQAILLTRLPKGYTEITSGLGEATPDCLLIVPLKYNDIVEAIAEIAGFGTFEPHQINFVERAGEFLASALLSVENTYQLKELLEISQQQSEIMRAQEEEMRQNMEELEATQEEMSRRNKEMEEVFFLNEKTER